MFYHDTTLQMSKHDPTLSRPVLELVTIATEYCLLIESAQPSGQNKAFMKTLTGFIPLLYLRGSLLTAAGPEHPEANERYVTAEQWDAQFLNLREVFGDSDEFWHIDYTELSHNDPIKASLAECLTDVYQDLKDFVLLFKQNSLAARENAIYSCFQLFQQRWGNCLAMVLPYLHTLNLNADYSLHDGIGPDFFV